MKICEWNILFTKNDDIAEVFQKIISRKGTLFFTPDDELARKIDEVINGKRYTSRMPLRGAGRKRTMKKIKEGGSK